MRLLLVFIVAHVVGGCKQFSPSAARIALQFNQEALNFSGRDISAKLSDTLNGKKVFRIKGSNDSCSFEASMIIDSFKTGMHVLLTTNASQRSVAGTMVCAKKNGVPGGVLVEGSYATFGCEYYDAHSGQIDGRLYAILEKRPLPAYSLDQLGTLHGGFKVAVQP